MPANGACTQTVDDNDKKKKKKEERGDGPLRLQGEKKENKWKEKACLRYILRYKNNSLQDGLIPFSSSHIKFALDSPSPAQVLTVHAW